MKGKTYIFDNNKINKTSIIFDIGSSFVFYFYLFFFLDVFIFVSMSFFYHFNCKNNLNLIIITYITLKLRFIWIKMTSFKIRILVADNFTLNLVLGTPLIYNVRKIIKFLHVITWKTLKLFFSYKHSNFQLCASIKKVLIIRKKLDIVLNLLKVFE